MIKIRSPPPRETLDHHLAGVCSCQDDHLCMETPVATLSRCLRIIKERLQAKVAFYQTYSNKTEVITWLLWTNVNEWSCPLQKEQQSKLFVSLYQIRKRFLLIQNTTLNHCWSTCALRVLVQWEMKKPGRCGFLNSKSWICVALFSLSCTAILNPAWAQARRVVHCCLSAVRCGPHRDGPGLLEASVSAYFQWFLAAKFSGQQKIPERQKCFRPIWKGIWEVAGKCRRL